MNRSLILAALFLLTVPAFAEDVTVHFDVSDSVRDAMARGEIKSLRVTIETQGFTDAKATTAVLHNVAPGTWKARAFIQTAMETYVVNPDGLKFDVVAGQPASVTLPVQSIFVTGVLTRHGKPFLAHQFSVWPSEHKRGSWGFAAPFDEQARFAFPVPHAGDYDLQVYSDDRKLVTTVRHFEIKAGDHEVHVELPEDIGH